MAGWASFQVGYHGTSEEALPSILAKVCYQLIINSTYCWNEHAYCLIGTPGAGEEKQRRTSIGYRLVGRWYLPESRPDCTLFLYPN